MKAIFTALIASSFFAVNVFSDTPPIEYPKLKPGEWRVSVENTSFPLASGMGSLFCIDEKSQQELITQSQKQPGQCNKPRLTKNKNTYITDVICELAGSRSRIHAETQFLSATQFRTETQITGGAMPAIELSTTARYVGSCQKGRRPGDMVVLGPSGDEMDQDALESLASMAQGFNFEFGQ